MLDEGTVLVGGAPLLPFKSSVGLRSHCEHTQSGTRKSHKNSVKKPTFITSIFQVYFGVYHVALKLLVVGLGFLEGLLNSGVLGLYIVF